VRGDHGTENVLHNFGTDVCIRDPDTIRPAGLSLDVAGDDAETWPEPDPKPVGLVGLFLMGGGDGTETHPESDPVTFMPTELSLM